MAQLTIVILPEQVEIGRFRKIAYQERFCQICDNLEVEMSYSLFASVNIIQMCSQKKFLHLLKDEWKLTDLYVCFRSMENKNRENV